MYFLFLSCNIMSYEVTKLRSYEVTQLRSYEVTQLRSYAVTQLRSYEVALLYLRLIYSKKNIKKHYNALY